MYNQNVSTQTPVNENFISQWQQNWIQKKIKIKYMTYLPGMTGGTSRYQYVCWLIQDVKKYNSCTYNCCWLQAGTKPRDVGDIVPRKSKISLRNLLQCIWIKILQYDRKFIRNKTSLSPFLPALLLEM